jgi:predicted amidohydrolase
MTAVTVTCSFFLAPACSADEPPEGWRAISPRDEIRPALSFEPQGGPKGTGSWVIAHDHRDGLDGWFEKSFPVRGGDYYRFQAVRKADNVVVPRRSALVRVRWQDDAGHLVPADVPERQAKELGHVPNAEPEFPVDGETDAQGWTTVSGIYRVPTRATCAVVELHLQWAPHGRIEWSDVEFAKTEPPPPRTVRLAAVHYRPTGKSPRENCEEFAPLLAEAAAQRADLVVLGETITAVGVSKKLQDTAEPIPGPTTAYFGELASQHRLHVVLSLHEREEHLIYNTAVLIGPDGNLIGKYRKVCLPHSEVESGVAPGTEYPVFDTQLGKVGLMICYDGFFPEVARELSNRGAEIIAWPVWGCNPLLAQARACENRVYLVSSTFSEPQHGWMLSAVFDQTGKPIAQADAWGTVAVAEVDLSRPYIGPYNLGDFRAMVPRHRPLSQPEPVTHDVMRAPAGFHYLACDFENASPVWYDFGPDGTIQVQLRYDHERDSPNRAAGHIHLRVDAEPGTKLTIELQNLENIYNGRPASVAAELKSLAISPDGVTWQSVATRAIAGARVALDVEMPGPQLYVARIEPYRLSDLDRWLASIACHPHAAISPIGQTVEGRPLEIVRAGDPAAQYHVFLRARAHPWESAGNWVVQGLVNRLLQDAPEARAFRQRYCLWVLPMANKDGVARGMTRFNLAGKDLNRDWDQPADPQLAPENHALETWLAGMIAAGRRPDLALDLHNDGYGRLSPARPASPQDQGHLERMAAFEALLRKHTWFTEGSTAPGAATVFTLADGSLQRFGVDAAVQEFNCDWIAGLNARPTGRHWESFGEGLAAALDEYFGAIDR